MKKSKTKPSMNAQEKNLEILLFAAEHDAHLPQIDLHGLNVHEAEQQVDVELDRAFVRHQRVVRIVHGHGSGRLRQALEPFVSHHPHVECVRGATLGAQRGAVMYAILKK